MARLNLPSGEAPFELEVELQREGGVEAATIELVEAAVLSPLAAPGSLPEVLGQAAAVVPQWDVEAWREAAHALLADEGRRKALRAAGLERVKQFRWEETAARTWDVYRGL